MYALGLPVLRRRKSTFINAAEADARDLAQHLVGYLAGCGAPALQRPESSYNDFSRN
jgi:putative flavoprotein involved in K+ transport